MQTKNKPLSRIVVTDPRLYIADRKAVKKQILALGFDSVRDFCQKNALPHPAFTSKLYGLRPLDAKTLEVLKSHNIQFTMLKKTYVEHIERIAA